MQKWYNSNMNKVMRDALLNASATALYIIAIGTFMNWVSKNLSHKPDTFLDPIVVLMLFVFSAAFTSYFVFGRGVLMYLDGKKKEAISLVTYTMIFLFCYTLLALVVLLVVSR